MMFLNQVWICDLLIISKIKKYYIWIDKKKHLQNQDIFCDVWNRVDLITIQCLIEEAQRLKTLLSKIQYSLMNNFESRKTLGEVVIIPTLGLLFNILTWETEIKRIKRHVHRPWTYRSWTWNTLQTTLRLNEWFQGCYFRCQQRVKNISSTLLYRSWE